ncbi:cytochrome c oxidase subunit II [Saliphagus infecundisoli]|uniref:Cytochrome c oxidase subunit II n=1 Tax=Saliphagus infecundisoli TaxID=1849069 RepID=A0ABD5QGN0_9EURY|nr:cytochrome c oxidase subunit II [Saliphagus infecundisoli]
MTTILPQLTTPLQQTRVDVFNEIFVLFLGLGTLVGIVVVSYTLYNAYKYRDDGNHGEDEDLPVVGELPTGGKGGRKLFLSFGLSAVIVLGLVFWSYQMLLYVEAGPGDEAQEEALNVDVEGQAFSWTFQYENGVESNGELVVPADREIQLNVTSIDVWHAFGIPDQRAKADAIPGEYSETWFIADAPENGENVTHEDAIECFELCGAGHSNMKADLTVMEEEAFQEWMAEQEAQANSGGNESGGGNESATGTQTGPEGNESSANGTDAASNESGANESSAAGAGGNATDAANETNAGNESDTNGTDASGDDGNNDTEDNETDGNADDESGQEGES